MTQQPNTERPQRIELLPCPFCGGKASIHENDPEADDRQYTIVFCEKCRVNNPFKPFMKLDDCIKAWNTRAALNGMQPDVTGDDDMLTQDVLPEESVILAKSREDVWALQGRARYFISRHRQSAVEAATGELMEALDDLECEASAEMDPNTSLNIAINNARKILASHGRGTLVEVGLTKAAQGGK